MSDTCRRVIKRATDFTVAAFGLLVLSPVLVALAAVIRISMGSPVFFRQQRPGLDARPFTLIKFRSMATGSGSDNERLTPLGRFLRSWSIDEIPSLFNVLLGHMSLVGPRPLLMEYLPLYSDEQRRRHQMRPGITGLAQVSGRNVTSWPERLSMDVEYVDRWTLRLDVRILVQTVKMVATRHGISEPGHVTKPPFTGTSLRSPHDA